MLYVSVDPYVPTDETEVYMAIYLTQCVWEVERLETICMQS